MSELDSESGASRISINSDSEPEDVGPSIIYLLSDSDPSIISINSDTDSSDANFAVYRVNNLSISDSLHEPEPRSPSLINFSSNEDEYTLSSSEIMPDLEAVSSVSSTSAVLSVFSSHSLSGHLGDNSVSSVHLSSMSGPSISEEDLFQEARRAGPNYVTSDDESSCRQQAPVSCYCTICLENGQGHLITTRCGHTFHYDCLRRACFAQERCPNCRSEFSDLWLHQNNLGVFMTSETFWSQFELSFGPVPVTGPLVPHQRRLQNWEDEDIGNITRLSIQWSRAWINEKLAELRMRYQIPESVVLTAADLRYCERCGIRRRVPTW